MALHAQELESVLQAAQQAIVAGRYDAAISSLQELDADTAGHPEVLYMLAVAHRYQRDYDKALTCLASLKQDVPEHGRAWQEEGHARRELRDFDRAVQAYENAVRFNPALLASWQALQKLYWHQGMKARASHAGKQAERLQKLPKALVAVTDLIAQGKLLKAEDYCRQFLQKFPHHVEAMRLLADIGIRLGVYDDAEVLLESACELEPDNEQLRIDYIGALGKKQKFVRAREQAQKLLESRPEDPRFQSIYAIESMQAGDFDAALDYFDRILKTLPDDAVTLTSKGHALKTLGNLDAAITAYRQVLVSNPEHGEAYHALANLKTYRFADAEIAQMQKLHESEALSFKDRIYLCFALGKALEDSADYAQSFAFYKQGNALKKQQSQYQASRMSEDLKAQQEHCSPELFSKLADAGCQAPDPIFILGLPRAGSTLLEQILSSHSQVDGTLELPNILSLSQRLRRRKRLQGGSDYPQNLHELEPDELRAFGEEFIRETRIHRQGAPFFIDKMPNNFRHIGLIRLILPNAKIIDARRNPMACCFSGYKQLFAEGQEFSYSLEDIGQYYRDYVELMAHWDQVLPGFVLRVNNEDLIADFENQVRRMLDFCGLPFEEACLNYHQTRRKVRTPSSEQVRQPISSAGVDQWRHFESFLEPLRVTLGPLAALSEQAATTTAGPTNHVETLQEVS